jgi:Tfp pilus assembly protein PilF
VTRTIAGARAGDPATVPGLIELATTARDAVHRASAARLLARFPTASGVSGTLVQATGDDEPLVRASAAWAIGQRPHLVPEVRAAVLTRTTDPLRVVRQHAAFALRDVDATELPPDVASTLRRALEEWRAGQLWVADTPEAHYNLALMDIARGQPEAALASYREALRLWPSSFQTRHNLGMLLAQLGRLDEARPSSRPCSRAMSCRTRPSRSGFFARSRVAGVTRSRRSSAASRRRPTIPVPATTSRSRTRRRAIRRRRSTRLERAASDDDTHRDAVLALIDLARQANDKPRLERWVLEAARLDPEVREKSRASSLLRAVANRPARRTTRTELTVGAYQTERMPTIFPKRAPYSGRASSTSTRINHRPAAGISRSIERPYAPEAPRLRRRHDDAPVLRGCGGAERGPVVRARRWMWGWRGWLDAEEWRLAGGGRR